MSGYRKVVSGSDHDGIYDIFGFLNKIMHHLNLKNQLNLHLCRKFKKCSDFYKTSYALPKGREKNIYEILSLYAAMGESHGKHLLQEFSLFL